MKTIALIGRPNVGKSALFNCLARRKISIVHDQPGVTRDHIHAVCKLGARPFEIVDTGGIGAEPDPDFAEDTHFAADVAMAAADLLLLVMDGPAGATPLDAELARRVRGSGKPVVIVVNKIDNDRQETLLADFARLGFDDPLGVSAAHGRGIGELVERIASEVRLEEEEPEPETAENIPRLAIIGRPNVGKSSLVNAILSDRRTIVSEISGTTRDAVDIPYEYRGTKFTLVDTAGIRHRSKHSTSVEVFSVMRSEQAIERADLNVLVVDATQGVTMQEKKIAGLIQKARKAAVIVLNKWDLVAKEGEDEEILKAKIEEIRGDLFFLDYAPIVVLSAKHGTNLPRLFNMIEKVRQHAARKIGTGELNRLFKNAIERQAPPMQGSRRFKILYATQLQAPKGRPFGGIEFLLFVNDPKKLSDSYQSYLSARIRDHCEYPGLPIAFKLRGRKVA
ncbi:MAG: ribosome biogenesis GTPase Der [Terrimicrobiaceae bacterium]|nr:ribosome biogenesis GTPase Der [Terrimicrobiaceae bacterium]